MDPAPLLAHIVSQTKQNIELLISHHQISQDDGQDILSKLSKSGVVSLLQQTENLSITSVATSTVPNGQDLVAPSTYNTINTGDASHEPSSPTPDVLFQARATWAYNENGESPGDLIFRAGDIIDVLAETNSDWWSGRQGDKTGLFPSNYVEKLSLQPAPALAPAQGHGGRNIGGALPSPASTPYSEKAPSYYGTTPALGYPYTPQTSYQGPPPTGPVYTPYNAQPSPVQNAAASDPQTAVPGEPKKSKFGGKFGNTLAHSAVGGVGFGAGSAIGSGLVNSIF